MLIVLCEIMGLVLFEQSFGGAICGFLTAALMMISYVILDELFKKR
jgi:hypothetical protein